MIAAVNNLGPAIREMQYSDVPAIVAIETGTYAFPWTATIFRDCLLAGYTSLVLEHAGELQGYAIMSLAAAEAHLPRYAAGTALCAAVNALGEHMAVALGPKGIRVNVLSPGFIVPTAAEINLDPEETATVLGGAVQTIPMGRIGAPSEVAEAALFLVTSSYVNGQVVRVDGDAQDVHHAAAHGLDGGLEGAGLHADDRLGPGRRFLELPGQLEPVTVR